MTLAESLLLAAHASHPAPAGGRVLVAGNRAGHIVAALAAAGAEVYAHVFDCHHARAMRERLAAVGCTDPGIVCCTADIPPHVYTRAYFMLTPRAMPAELVLDQLEDIRAHLAPGGELIAAFEGSPDDALRTMKRVFARVHVWPLPDDTVRRAPRVRGVVQAALFRVVQPAHETAVPRRDFTAEWPASVPGGPQLTFLSRPGCFCHRRADLGGLALAETACGRAGAGAPARTCRILDMGCGCGFVGLLVAERLRAQGTRVQLTLLDSHARALATARENAARLGLEDARAVLSDTGLPPDEPPAYDLFLGNPPYFGDWRIAETFVATARRALVPGGCCLTVSKNAGGLHDVQNRIFGAVETLKRRGYFVFSSTAPAP